MLLIGLIVLLLGLGFVLLPCLQCVRASLTRAPTPMRVVLAPQVETIRTFFSEVVPVAGARVCALSTELFSDFSGDAPRAPSLFLKKVDSNSLGLIGHVGIGFTSPFFLSPISATTRAIKAAIQNFRTRLDCHRNRPQSGGNPRASPFPVTVWRSALA
jgi:hypothetical protein